MCIERALDVSTGDRTPERNMREDDQRVGWIRTDAITRVSHSGRIGFEWRRCSVGTRQWLKQVAKRRKGASHSSAPRFLFAPPLQVGAKSLPLASGALRRDRTQAAEDISDRYDPVPHFPPSTPAIRNTRLAHLNRRVIAHQAAAWRIGVWADRIKGAYYPEMT
jgi:hypothetical protein